jgi:hypothetical protein
MIRILQLATCPYCPAGSGSVYLDVDAIRELRDRTPLNWIPRELRDDLLIHNSLDCENVPCPHLVLIRCDTSEYELRAGTDVQTWHKKLYWLTPQFGGGLARFLYEFKMLKAIDDDDFGRRNPVETVFCQKWPRYAWSDRIAGEFESRGTATYAEDVLGFVDYLRARFRTFDANLGVRCV